MKHICRCPGKNFFRNGLIHTPASGNHIYSSGNIGPTADKARHVVHHSCRYRSACRNPGQTFRFSGNISGDITSLFLQFRKVWIHLLNAVKLHQLPGIICPFHIQKRRTAHTVFLTDIISGQFINKKSAGKKNMTNLFIYFRPILFVPF